MQDSPPTFCKHSYCSTRRQNSHFLEILQVFGHVQDILSQINVSIQHVQDSCQIDSCWSNFNQDKTSTFFGKFSSVLVGVSASVLLRCLVHVHHTEIIFASVFMLIHVGAGTHADDHAGIYIEIFWYSPVKVLVKFIARPQQGAALSKSRGFYKFWKMIRFFIVFSKWYRFPVGERAGLARPYMPAWAYNYMGI